MNYTRPLTAIVALVAVLGSTPVADELSVEAPIKRVVVYSDRAKVTRVAEIELSAGEQALLVENLPGGVIDGSIRASASGAAGIMLLGLSHSTKQHLEAPVKKVADLEAEQENLERNHKQVVTDRLQAFTQLKEFVAALSSGASDEITRQVADGGIDVSQWTAAYAFVGEKNFQLNDSIRLAKQELQDIEDRIRIVQTDLRRVSTARQRTTKTVRVDLDLERAGLVDLTLEYIIPGAQWTPLYDARIGDNPDRVQFTYHAEVSQKTGEDWTGVELTLSTARPSLGAGPGQLSPWFLAELPQIPSRSYTVSTGPIRGRITRRDTGEPVVGASILVVGTAQGDMTDLDGRFRILRVDPGIYTLRISHIEFVTVEITNVVVAGDQTFVINQRMEPKVTDLDRTITVIGRQDTLDKFVVDSRVTMSSETIRQRPVQTVDNLLAQVAGLRTNSRGGAFVRGGAAGEVADIVDGVAMGDPYGGSLGLVSGAIVNSGAYPTVFEIKRKESVSSGGEAVRVTVANWVFDGETKLISRPHNRQGAYRVVTMKNQDAAPLLPGRVAVFAGSHFLGQAQFDQLVAPGGEFDLPFGLDNHVTVEREVLAYKKTRKGTKIRTDQTIQITLRNHGSAVREVELEESLPVTRDSRIKVKIGKIVPKPTSEDQKGSVTWKLMLQPDEEIKVSVPYRISYPSRLRIAGL